MDAATPNQLLGWWIQITWYFPAFIVPSVLATSQTMTEPPPVQSLNLKIVKYKTRLTLSEKAATVQEKVLKDFLKKKNNLENYCSRLLYEIFSLYSCKQNTKKWGVTQYLFTAQHHTVSDIRRIHLWFEYSQVLFLVFLGLTSQLQGDLTPTERRARGGHSV